MSSLRSIRPVRLILWIQDRENVAPRLLSKMTANGNGRDTITMRTRVIGVVIVGLLVASVLTTFPPPAAAIVNAEDQLTGAEVPAWAVRIDTGPGRCSGALIDSEFIVTAAHCVIDANNRLKPGSDFTVFFGGGGGRSIAEAIPRQFSNATGQNDIALLRLATPVNTQIVGPNLFSRASYGGATLYGYGQRFPGAARDTTLRTLTADSIDTSATPLRFNPRGDNTLTCDGDSGGPIVWNGLLVAVHSGAVDTNNDGCADRSANLAVAEISDHIDWIRGRMAASIEAGSNSCDSIPFGVDPTNFNIVVMAWGNSPTSGRDLILGRPTRDIIHAGDGNDVVCGRGGDDTINGNIGVDRIDGGTGNDILRGGAGGDLLIGGFGEDTISGDAGPDIIDGGGGDDRLLGGRGADHIEGRGGDDFVRGGKGKDTINGGNNEDTLNGERGDDTIDGGFGTDTVSGGAGEDVCIGESTDETCEI